MRETPASPSAGAVITCRDGSRPRVLLAEDSHAARLLTAALIRRMGCEVDAAEHGEEALDYARSRDYSLIILDIEMPVMDGVAAAREIRALGARMAGTPIIALSAFLADTQNAQHWTETFDVAMAKPAGRDDLRRVIQATLDGSGAGGDVPAVVSTRWRSGRDGRETLIIDREAMDLARANLAPATWAKLLESALSEMRDSAEALRRAAANPDPAQIVACCHRIRGLALSLAGRELARRADELEQQAKSGRAVHMTELDRLNECIAATLQAMADLRAA